MSGVKERIVGAVTVMSERDATMLWSIITENFPHWGNIRVELPDEVDKEMLEEISSDPECKEFVSEEEALKELGL